MAGKHPRRNVTEASCDQKLKELLREAYADTHEKMKVPAVGEVVKDGLIISYGPPISRPDMLLISFQGGANTHRDTHDTWPERLHYLDSTSKDSTSKFGKNLRQVCRDTDLYHSLDRSAMALPAVFPQAPDREAKLWKRKTGPHADWRMHSVDWVRRLTREIRPKVVIVFGRGTSDALGIVWEQTEHNHKQGWLTFGASTFEGYPALYCMHLSRPSNDAVLKSFRYAKGIIEAG